MASSSGKRTASRLDGWGADWKTESRRWKDDWRANRRAARESWREEKRRSRELWHTQHDEWHGHRHGVGAVILGIIIAVLWIVFILSVISFLSYGMVFGYAIGAGHPLWVTLLFLLLIFWLVSLPFKMMIHSGHPSYGHHHSFGDGIWTLILLVLLFYLGSMLFPSVHNAWVHVVTYLQTVR